MKKNILALSLLFSFLGILGSFYFVFIKLEDLVESIAFIFFNARPYYFSGMDIYIVTERINENSYSSTSLGLLNLFFYLSFLSGTIVYYFSKYKETKLLTFNYSLIFLSSIIKIIYYILFFNIRKHDYTEIIYIGLALAYLFISYHFLTKYLLLSEKNSTDNENKTNENYLENASGYKRFLNLIIDGLFIIIIAYTFLDYTQKSKTFITFFGSLESTFGKQFGTLVFVYIVKFIYYLVLESILKSTPAKYLTSCYVTDEEGNKPNFSMIFKRTLCRFIPFESFSFLIGKNLHDDYSDTYVINRKRNLTTEKLYMRLLGLSFIVILVIYFYNISQK